MGFLSVFLQITLDTESLSPSSPWGEKSHGEWNEQGTEGRAECLGVFNRWQLAFGSRPLGGRAVVARTPWTDWGSQELCPCLSPIGMCLCNINRQWGCAGVGAQSWQEGSMSVCILK